MKFEKLRELDEELCNCGCFGGSHQLVTRVTERKTEIIGRGKCNLHYGTCLKFKKSSQEAEMKE